VPAIAILSFSPVARDARVLRQLKYLAQIHTVEAWGYGPAPELPGQNIVYTALPQSAGLWPRLRKAWYYSLGRLTTAAYEAWYWGVPEYRQAAEQLASRRPRLIHANDLLALPAASRAAQADGARLILDLHEYAPLEMENRLAWRVLVAPLVRFILERYLPGVTATVTVNQTIADRYAQEYGVQPLVVMNAAEYTPDIVFRPTDPACVRLIHHGGAARDRQLERMIDVAALADRRYELHFMLVGDPVYVSELEAYARRRAPGRVFFHAAVPTRQILAKLQHFDIGLYRLPPNNFNNRAATPNKFFDFVAAGLAVCIGPSPEMARLTETYGFGRVAADFTPEALARTLNALTPAEIDSLKRNALSARTQLNAQVEMSKLQALYGHLLAGSA